MTEGDFDCLCKDIEENGLREPIVMHEGMILDGGNRYRACVETGTAPSFKDFCGGSVVAFVLSANLHRRHLSPGQQAAIVASCADWANTQPVGKPKSGHVAPLQTVADRAAQAGVSERTQKRADKVAKESPELAMKVAHGDISLPKAIESISPKKQKEPDSEFVQDYELEEAREAIRSLSTENDQLKDRLSIGSTDDPEEAKATVLRTMEELREQVRCLEIENAAIKASRNHFQSENAELKKQVTYWRKQAEKAA